MSSNAIAANENESFIKGFDFMGEEERMAAMLWWRANKIGKTYHQQDFLEIVRAAGKVIKEDYYIANLEPSMNKRGRLYYKKGSKVVRKLSCNEWRKKAQEFAPDWKSDLATKYQLALWYAYRIAKGYWTIEYVCDDSSSEGNYWNAPDSAHTFEVSGARKVGGAQDGVGNTSKIVTDEEDNFCFFGGYYFGLGDDYRVADINDIHNPDNPQSHGTGVVVLNKSCNAKD